MTLRRGDGFCDALDATTAMTVNDLNVTPAQVLAAQAEVERTRKRWHESGAPCIQPADVMRQQASVANCASECAQWQSALQNIRRNLDSVRWQVRWYRLQACLLDTLQRPYYGLLCALIAVILVEIVVVGVAVFSPRLAMLLELMFVSIAVLLYALWVLLKERALTPVLSAKTARAAANMQHRLAEATMRLSHMQATLTQVQQRAQHAALEWNTASKTYSIWRHALQLKAAHDDSVAKLAELLEVVHSRRYQLLHTNWRDLRGEAFELFLKDVFEMLGFAVSLTKASGDQGIDLILSGAGRVIGVQAKGYHDSVGNHAVMEAHAGMTHYQCQCSAVVTNSSFTRAAKELAASVNCRLVSGDEIPDLILGNLPI